MKPTCASLPLLHYLPPLVLIYSFLRTTLIPDSSHDVSNTQDLFTSHFPKTRLDFITLCPTYFSLFLPPPLDFYLYLFCRYSCLFFSGPHTTHEQSDFSKVQSCLFLSSLAVFNPPPSSMSLTTTAIFQDPFVLRFGKVRSRIVLGARCRVLSPSLASLRHPLPYGDLFYKWCIPQHTPCAIRTTVGRERFSNFLPLARP